MNFIRFILLIIALIGGSVSAFSADETPAVSVRLSDHGDKVRTVFDWDGSPLPSHHIKWVDDHTLEISFEGKGTLSSFTPIHQIPEVSDIRLVSAPSAPLRVWVLTSSHLSVRDFVVGSRLMLDFGLDQAARAKIKEPGQFPPAPTPLAQSSEKSFEKTAVKTPVLAPPAESLVPAMAIDPKDPPVITLSSLSPFGAASYVHLGRLWIVVDQPNFTAGPQVTGKGAGQIPPFERLTLSDATVYYTRLPKGIMPAMHGDGGDLMWRVVFAPGQPRVSSISPRQEIVKSEARLVWPVKDPTKIILFKDPISGELAFIAPVKKSDQYTGAARVFADFRSPQTVFGVVVLPRVDDLKMDIGAEGVVITRGHGLSVTSAEAAEVARRSLPPPPGVGLTTSDASLATPVGGEGPATSLASESLAAPFYRFDRWALGGSEEITKNENMLAEDLGTKKIEDRAGGLMNIGKMFLANNRGAEALGYFRLASEAQPGLLETPDFLGVRGAAYAINGQFDLAYEDLRVKELESYPDVGAWRAYALANLQDWQQAGERVKRDVTFVRQYPRDMAGPMVLTFAEILLRAGKVTDAQKILTDMEPAAGGAHDPKAKVKKKQKIDAAPYIIAYHTYLQGEAARQAGKKDSARAYWEGLLKDPDDKYRARARLALTIMNYEEGKIKSAQAIDELEGLRYAWRGDELEASINARLGEIYLDGGDYLRGLNVLRDAATLAPETDIGRRITATMSEKFRSLFLGDSVKKINPLDAITVYEKFSELMPAGDDANKMTFNLVDRLMEVDLLDRAAKVLKDMADNRLSGRQKIDGELRLAGIQLLNDQPGMAMKILNQVSEKIVAMQDPELMEPKIRELKLLKAQGLYKNKQIDAALNLLKEAGDDIDYLKARADIAWRSARWREAADALSSILAKNHPKAGEKLTNDQADMIRNMAVAVNLSGDRGTLAQVRAHYEHMMVGMDQFKTFDIVTRVRHAPTLADRDTLNRLVAEVDLFGGFLDSYRKTSLAILKSSSSSAGTAATAADPLLQEQEKGNKNNENITPLSPENLTSGQTVSAE